MKLTLDEAEFLSIHPAALRLLIGYHKMRTPKAAGFGWPEIPDEDRMDKLLTEAERLEGKPT